LFAHRLVTWEQVGFSLAPFIGPSRSELQERSFGYVYWKWAYMCFRDWLFNGQDHSGPFISQVVLKRFAKYEKAAAALLGATEGIQFLPLPPTFTRYGNG
jgi:hypothetical protein